MFYIDYVVVLLAFKAPKLSSYCLVYWKEVLILANKCLSDSDRCLDKQIL